MIESIMNPHRYSLSPAANVGLFPSRRKRVGRVKPLRRGASNLDLLGNCQALPWQGRLILAAGASHQPVRAPASFSSAQNQHQCCDA